MQIPALGDFFYELIYLEFKSPSELLGEKGRTVRLSQQRVTAMDKDRDDDKMG